MKKMAKRPPIPPHEPARPGKNILFEIPKFIKHESNRKHTQEEKRFLENINPNDIVKRYSSKWNLISTIKPDFGDICDIVVNFPNKKPEIRRDLMFVPNVGVNQNEAFQPVSFYLCGLYEDAFFLYEGIISHWCTASQQFLPEELR